MERLSLSGTLPVETALCPYADRLRYSATLQIEGRAVICDDVFPLTEAGARYFLGTSVLFTADRPTAADLFMVRLADEYLGVGEVEINCLTDGAPQDALFFTLRLAYAALRDELSNLMLGDEGYHGFAAEAGLRALLYGARGNRDWSYTTVLGEISRVVELFERAGLGDVVNREQVDALFTRTLPDDAPRAGEHG
ncbi:MAG: hypothetical protein HY696_10900 [Deltaproteobacteria bacterium]|nr:hypothetical protein [Deltaproteobacteria bacterium]